MWNFCVFCLKGKEAKAPAWEKTSIGFNDAKKVFKLGSEITGISLEDLCLIQRRSLPKPKCTACKINRVNGNRGFENSGMLSTYPGFSLGSAAHFVPGVFGLEDGFRIV